MEDFERLTTITSNFNPTGRVGSRSYRSIQDAQIPVSIRNEIRAMKNLKSICEDYLSAYPTTYDDDVYRLNDENSSALPPFSNERHALIQVKGEKEVLLFFKDFSTTAIQLLEIRDDVVFNRELAAIWPSKHVLIQQYLSNCACRLRQSDKQRTEMRQRNVDFSRPTVV